MIDYETMYEKLKQAGLRPCHVVNVGDGETVALEVYSPAIQSDVRLKIVNEICGDLVRATWFPNSETINIQINHQCLPGR